MRWKSSVISSRACSGALRTRLRSLCTQQRCTGVLPQTSESARRRPALPSTMQSSGTLSPRSTRSSRKPFHASFDSLPHISSDTSCFCPSASTATAASTGTLVTLPALRTRSAIASKYRYATSSSANERFVHASRAPQRADDPRDRALRERRRLEQRPERTLDAPRVRAGKVRARYCLVDLGAPPLIARHQLRRPLARAARGEQRGT